MLQQNTRHVTYKTISINFFYYDVIGDQGVAADVPLRPPHRPRDVTGHGVRWSRGSHGNRGHRPHVLPAPQRQRVAGPRKIRPRQVCYNNNLQK